MKVEEKKKEKIKEGKSLSKTTLEYGREIAARYKDYVVLVRVGR